MPGILALKLPQIALIMAKTNKKSPGGKKGKSLSTLKISTTTSKSGPDLSKIVK